MGSFGFSLADRLGAKTVPCSVKGCTRTWIVMAGKGARLGGRPPADPTDPSSSMCDPCREKVGKLADAERPCDRPGCTGTWTWPVMAQLEAWATKRQPPRSLCAEDETRLGALEEKEVPCTVPGCTRTAVWTKRAQLLAGAPDPSARPDVTMCPPCANVSGKLRDRPVTCGIMGCKRKWIWPLDEQMQAFATGKPNEPPRRMCDECKTVFGAIADREVKCRTSGCKKTWTFTRGDQLDACVEGKPPPKAPARMCEDCHTLFTSLKDVERPCRRATCKRTWTDKRGAQLARAARGKTGDPYPRYCGECEKEMGELEDRQMPCRTDGCEGTWTWLASQQLAAGVRPPGAAANDAAAAAAGEGGGEKGKRKRKREARPPERHCESCSEFLTNHKTQELPCSRCSTPIFWPPESQLQTHLGNWAAPSLCGACKRDVIEAARQAEREALRANAMINLGGATPAASAPGGNGTPAAAPADDPPAADPATATE